MTAKGHVTSPESLLCFVLRQTLSSLSIYLVKGKLLAQELVEMCTFELQKLLSVYVKSLLEF